MDAFEVKPTSVKVNNISDYEVFSDKDMLDNFRSKIIQNLIDENIPDDKLLEQYINDEIDNTTMGYDLDYLQRSYIFTNQIFVIHLEYSLFFYPNIDNFVTE